MVQYLVDEFIINYYKLECHVCKCQCKCSETFLIKLLEQQSRWRNQWFTLPTIVVEYIRRNGTLTTTLLTATLLHQKLQNNYNWMVSFIQIYTAAEATHRRSTVTKFNWFYQGNNNNNTPSLLLFLSTVWVITDKKQVQKDSWMRYEMYKGVLLLKAFNLTLVGISYWARW